jgi:hypothetical protein
MLDNASSSSNGEKVARSPPDLQKDNEGRLINKASKQDLEDKTT